MALKPDRRAYLQYDEGEQVLSLRDIVGIILRHLWIVVLLVFVLTGAALGIGLAQTPTYEASIKVLVGQRQEGAVAGLSSDVEGLQQLTGTLTQAVDSRPVAEVVIERLNLEMSPESLLDNLEAQQVAESNFIEVTYQDSQPERARLIANTTGQELTALIAEVSPDNYAVTATVWETAETPDDPVSPNLKLYVFMALIVGAALGLASAFLLEALGVGSDEDRGPGADRDVRPRAVGG